MSKPLFDLGQIVATPGALALGVDFSPYIGMHQRGYWGDVCQDDWQANDQSVKEGSRILSAYETQKGKIWIITEHDVRHVTVCGIAPKNATGHSLKTCDLSLLT